MSVISEALKGSNQSHLLVELDFNGLVKRYAAEYISVPYAGGQPKLFRGLITKDFKVGSKFSISNLRYAVASVSITIADKDRLQDLETRRRLDGGTGRIWVWCPGLDWSDIETAGLIFKGAFKKSGHTETTYSFSLVDPAQDRLADIPPKTINSEAWPYHAPGTSGKAAQIVFGDWPGGVPLVNVARQVVTPQACCTDKDDDQDNTDGWTAQSLASISSITGGVTGNCLYVQTGAGPNGYAKSSEFSLESGKKYVLRLSVYPTNSGAMIYVYSTTHGGTALNKSFNPSTAWADYEEEFTCPSTQADWCIHCYALIAGGGWSKWDNIYLVTEEDYLAMMGIAVSQDSDYEAGSENIFDKDDIPISWEEFDLSTPVDGIGNPATIFTFSEDQAEKEPLTCSIQGLKDASGEYTGQADALIEHPADISRYILEHYSGLEADLESFKTLRSLRPDWRFASLINRQAKGMDIIDRILSQALAARMIRPGGKTGVMVLDLDQSGPVMIRLRGDVDMVDGSIKLSQTPEHLVINNIEIQYALNPSSGNYEGSITRDWTNNAACELSYQQYGQRPKKTVRCSDVQAESIALAILARHLDLYVFRRDILQCNVPYHKGFDAVEGDLGLITITEGSSLDGSGWTEEPCVLLTRTFKANTIGQQWLRINTG